VTDIALERTLTKVVKGSKKNWVERLVESTWAYKTTYNTTNGFTQYDIVYGNKALLSIVFKYNTLTMVALLDMDLTKA